MLVYHDGEALYIANATADSEPRRISPTGVGSYYPTWSPDGSRIAFVADGTVCTVRANGSAARAVAYRASYGIAWQPARYSVGGEPRYPCVATRWDLALHVTASRKRAAVGDDVAFSVALSNKGPHPAVESPEFIIEWGEDLQFGSVDTSGRLGEECAPLVRSGHWITAVSCRADIVFPGRPVTIATVTLGARGPGPQLVTAAMREFSHPHDTNLDNDRDSATVRIRGCTITGTAGSDILIGTRRSDVICGLDGNDVVRGLGGNDEIWSGPGDDVVDGGPGNDRLLTGVGDEAAGGAGDDVLWGGFGRDSLSGGGGLLEGGDRNTPRVDPISPNDSDVLDGGPGAMS